MRRRPSATTAIACLALFFALAGTGLAAGKYLITSKSQIKPSVLKELRGNRGPAGAPGAAGAAGAAGPQGTISASNLTVVDGPATSISPDTTGTSVAVCPSGDTALSGGWAGPLDDTTISSSEPDGTNQWEVVAANASPETDSLTAIAVCAS
ncbi:MAG: hypothetical protein ABSH27_11405 [Solirubrobacteraceae bacterium]|jgi:hypothetical protein